MSLSPNLFRLRREFQAVGVFHDLMAQAETGDIITLFDQHDRTLQARCGSEDVLIKHSNSYVAVGSRTQTKGERHLWLYRYDGSLLSDLGVHVVDAIMPIADRGILIWKTCKEETDADSTMLSADTITLVRPNGIEESIFIGEGNAETDSVGNLYIVQEKQFVRIHVTENDIERKEYLGYDPLFSDEWGPNYLVSGDSLWILDKDNSFIRIDPQGSMTTIPQPHVSGGINQWYAQDEWLVVLSKDHQHLQVFKDGHPHVMLKVLYSVEELVAVGSLGVVYGTNWDGEYSYFLMTMDNRSIFLTEYDEAYFCVMVPEGMIMPDLDLGLKKSVTLIVCV